MPLKGRKRKNAPAGARLAYDNTREDKMKAGVKKVAPRSVKIM